MAIWEFAPGSPWNAIFMDFVVVFVMAPCISRSGFCQYLAGGFEVGRRIDAARHGVDDSDVDPHAGLDRPELLELLAQFQHGGRQPDVTLQGLPAIGVEADMMIARSVAPWRRGAGEVKRAQPPRADRRADRLHHVRVQA